MKCVKIRNLKFAATNRYKQADFRKRELEYIENCLFVTHTPQLYWETRGQETLPGVLMLPKNLL